MAEQTKRFESKPTDWLLVSAAGALVLTSLGAAIVQDRQQQPERLFDQQFSGDGKCLNGSIYDPEKDATVLKRDVDGQDVLTVLPETLPVNGPALLNFTIADDAETGQKLKFADTPTASVLMHECEMDGGY